MSELDTPMGCVRELTDCNQRMAEFGQEWSREAGQLARLEKYYQRLFKEALRRVDGRNAEERTADAHAIVEKTEPGISSQIEQLTEKVEDHKFEFRVLDRRSSNAQSVLSLHRDEARLGEHVAP